MKHHLHVEATAQCLHMSLTHVGEYITFRSPSRVSAVKKKVWVIMKQPQELQWSSS
jgi:hypothetical protein